jgi:hypothetical protein
MTPFFDDWKHFCFVLREIAAGTGGQPLSGIEAQTRARRVLAEAGYRWSGYMFWLNVSKRNDDSG